MRQGLPPVPDRGCAMRRCCLVAVLLAAFVALAVRADDKGGEKKPSPRPEPPKRPGAAMVDDVFRRMDRNQDGKIDRKEAQARVAENFDRLDANKDGFVDRDEM